MALRASSGIVPVRRRPMRRTKASDSKPRGITSRLSKEAPRNAMEEARRLLGNPGGGTAGPFAFLCGGSVTPWGENLVGEELTWDARKTTNQCSDSSVKALGRAAGWYYGAPGNALPNPPNIGNVDNSSTKATAESQFRPYNYGSVVSAKVAPDGTVATKKLWTMGRLNHELAVVLPDQRTVLTTDDFSANGLFAMFVADV